MTTEITETT